MLERRYKEARQSFAPDDPENSFKTKYGKKQKPTAPPAVEVIETDNPRVSAFERKFKRDIKVMLNEHKQISVAAYRAILRHQKRRLLLEKLRRLELSIAEREGARK